MRDISNLLSPRLSGATTLCHCWRLSPRDGTSLGFTDHDSDLSFGGIVYSARAGLSAGAVESALGFAVGGGEVAGALTSAAISEADIANGRFDGASVETWLVDWSDPDARLLLDAGVIGEVRRSEFSFSAEVRSIAHDLDQPFGRYFQSGCAADLGDSRCGIDMTAPAYRASGAVLATDGRLNFTIADGGQADGWFANGIAAFVSGACAGERLAIKGCARSAAGLVVSLWTARDGSIAIGDQVVLTAGCDKRLSTCAAKFANQTNFRGFPHIPGIDVLLSYANSNGPAMDGGSLFR